MDAIGDMADRHLVQRPARIKAGEQTPAHFAMKPADAVALGAAAQRQKGGVEGLVVVARIAAPQTQQVALGDVEFRQIGL